MFPGGFRAKLNSRSHHRASVFATTVVALLPSFLALSPLLAYAYFSNYTDRLKGEECTFLTCVSLCADHALSFLAARWNTAARAFRPCRSVGSRYRLHSCVTLVGNRGKRRDCIVGTRKMSVTYLFSPNKLIDYCQAICIRLLTSTRYLRTSITQTRNLRPTSLSFEKPPSS